MSGCNGLKGCSCLLLFTHRGRKPTAEFEKNYQFLRRLLCYISAQAKEIVEKDLDVTWSLCKSNKTSVGSFFFFPKPPNPLIPKSDYQLISPNNITPESNITVTPGKGKGGKVFSNKFRSKMVNLKPSRLLVNLTHQKHWWTL